MSGLFGPAASQSQRPSSNISPVISSYKAQTAVEGLVIPIVYGGPVQIPGNIFYAGKDGDLQAIPVTTSSGGQISGKGGGGAPPQSGNTTWQYYLPIFWGLAVTISKIRRMWADKAQYRYGSYRSMTLVPGSQPQAPVPWLAAAHPDQALGYAGLAFLYDPQADLGSNAQLPNWLFEAWGGLLYTGLINTITDEEHVLTAAHIITVPGIGGNIPAPPPPPGVVFQDPYGWVWNLGETYTLTGGSITVARHQHWAAESLGVYLLNTGGGGGLVDFPPEGSTRLTLVASNPALGEYTTDGAGHYGFNAAETGSVSIFYFAHYYPNKVVTVTFADDWLDDQGAKINDVALTKVEDDPGPGEYKAGSGIYTFCGDDCPLGTEVPKISYRTNTIPGSNPGVYIPDFLSNPYYGAGFDAAKIGALTQFSNYCVASGYFLSPVFNEQKEGREHLADQLKLLNSQALWSEDLLQIIPLGDETVTGNGVTYTPNLTPVFDLDEDDFIFTEGEDPVQFGPPETSQIYNKIPLEYVDRDNNYKTAIVDPDDLAHIQAYGLRRADTILAHAINQKDLAGVIARNILHYSLYAQKPYRFKLGIIGDVLEPVKDLVTLTSPRLGLDHLVVRIKDMKKNAGDRTWDITAVEWPFGAAQAALYPVQGGGGPGVNFNAPANNINPPVIFEAPALLTAQGLEVWVAGSGDPNFGGAEIWGSHNGDEYQKIGEIASPARTGKLSATLPVGAATDTVNTLAVDLTESRGTLLGTSPPTGRQKFPQIITSCYVDGEIISYINAALTAAYKYDLTYLLRGQYLSTIAAHAAISQFARLDGAVFKLPFTPDQIGTSLYLKFLAQNTTGGGRQSLADVEPYQHTLTGAALRLPPPDPTGVVTFYRENQLMLKWDAAVDPLAGYRPLDYEVRRGATWDSAQAVSWVTNPEFVTQGDGTYWIAARVPWVYSVNPASVVVSGSTLPANVVVSYDESAEGWPGTLI